MATVTDRKPAVLKVPFWSEFGEDVMPVSLEKRCPVCRLEPREDCEVCRGKGFVLTPNGRAVLRLIARHGLEVA